ncbi:MAG: putative toxin-antitoxin system toxin component, PIN family [Treponema sp.]|nr:putative toxin-antitoxin system toxin component, PIN family [Treponema sp.]
MIKIVLDTNILVSSLLTLGPPASIMDIMADGKIIPFYTKSIFQEYYDVLSRKKFGFSSLLVSRLIDNIINTGIAVEDKTLNTNKKINKDDQIFYNAAIEAQAYLITGNIRHFPKESFIVTPAQFLREIWIN